MGTSGWGKVIQVFLVLLIVGGCNVKAESNINHPKIILIIHSYNSDYKWTQQESEGVLPSPAAQGHSERVGRGRRAQQ